MDPVTHSQQLCPLRSYAPNFLGENPTTCNRSHSPQPPPRKRLYSEDFNSFLMDADCRPDARDRARPAATLDAREPFEKSLNESVRPESRFPEDAFAQPHKSEVFFGQEDPDDSERIGDGGTFGTARDDFAFEGIGSYLGAELARDDKHKHHFQEIFDAGDKNSVLLGKRDFPSKGSRTGPRFGEQLREGCAQELKVEENSAYVFKRKRIKADPPPKTTGDFASPKQTQSKRRPARLDSAPKAETRGSALHG